MGIPSPGAVSGNSLYKKYVETGDSLKPFYPL